jgi:hypothetical protein
LGPYGHGNSNDEKKLQFTKQERVVNVTIVV